MNEVTRDEHLAWCKTRALKYLDIGDVKNAVASMGSDLTKHPGTNGSSGLMMLGISYAINNDAAGARRWIEGFR